MMLAHEVDMQRLRLKADGRIVELRDGREFPLAPALPIAQCLIADEAPPEAGRIMLGEGTLPLYGGFTTGRNNQE